eukprot:TRINITY_DN28_c0_g1_i1.p1 TRINITY_DN28_c0_g1~~TRINITY_DN28_c0_g1_i1.p1  ORF type:complete len:428 (-),score=79.76 TRINITY_DN28_c0_g1_i1:81-1364(-)
MSKLLLASLLFAAVAYAALDQGHKTQWYASVLEGGTHYGMYVGQGDGTYTQGCGNSATTTLGTTKSYCLHTDRAAYMNTSYCYIYFYNELGCTGEPQGWWGYQQKAQATPSWTPNKYQVENQGSRLSWYDCTTATCSQTTTLPGNLPIGCTDYEYTWLNAEGTKFVPIFPTLAAFTAWTGKSIFVVCNGEVPCPRDCAGRKCGEYDGCGRPCVADCATDGYYCATDMTDFVCQKTVQGQLTYYTQIKYAPGAYTPKSALARNDQMYTDPTFTHIENAFVDDLSRATENLIPADAIFLTYRYYTHSAALLDIYFTINVDTCYAAKNTVTRASLQKYLAQLFKYGAGYQNKGKLMGGVFTRYMDLNQGTYQYASDAGIASQYPTQNTDDEWKSVVIPDSWLPVIDEESGAASVVACLAAIFAALLVHLA